MNRSRKGKDAKAWWVPFITIIGVLALIFFIKDITVNFFVFWFLILINFGFTLTAAVIYIMFFPTYFIAAYGRLAQFSFLIINIVLGIIVIFKAIKGISK